MAENGSFRTGIGGFNKTDVLNYIDALQTEHTAVLGQREEELELCRSQLAEAQQRLTEAEQALQQNTEQLAALLEKAEEQRIQLETAAQQEREAEQARQAAEQLVREKASLQEQLAGMRTLADMAEEWQQEAETLREELRTAASAREQEGAAAQQRIDELHTLLEQERAWRDEQEAARQQQAADREELTRQLTSLRQQVGARDEDFRRLEEENREYAELVEDVGSFVMELRSMGRRYLDTIFSRSSDCLNTVDGAIGLLSEQLDDVHRDMEAARQELEENSRAAELRLEDWSARLENSTKPIHSKTSSVSPEAAEQPDHGHCPEEQIPADGSEQVEESETAASADFFR